MRTIVGEFFGDEFHQRFDALSHFQSCGIDDELRCRWGFVRRGDTGEICDLAGASPFVQPLGIASLTGLEVCRDIDLEELVACSSARQSAILAIRRDERRYANHAGLCKE